jgi:hypothetical protein
MDIGSKSIILTMVDQFSKYCHFIPLAHPYTAESVALVFFAEIVRLHGVSRFMVLDRDPVFTSVFWKELMHLFSAKLHITSAFHPQSDGQTEAANKVIIMYLRCLTSDQPRQVALAPVGGVHRQHGVPDLAEGDAIQDHLRP